jgi:hypothetical protein
MPVTGRLGMSLLTCRHRWLSHGSCHGTGPRVLDLSRTLAARLSVSGVFLPGWWPSLLLFRPFLAMVRSPQSGSSVHFLTNPKGHFSPEGGRNLCVPSNPGRKTGPDLPGATLLLAGSEGWDWVRPG